jgi:hypothetical protein
MMLAVAVLLCAGVAMAQYPRPPSGLRLNQMQVIAGRAMVIVLPHACLARQAPIGPS